MDGIRIIHEPNPDEPFLVVDKDSGLPSAPIKNSTDSALERALKLFPILKTVVGKKSEEYGLVHRIDTVTQGLLLIAASQDFYEWILKCQEQGSFVKFYNATCKNLCVEDDSFPDLPHVHEELLEKGHAELKSKFRYYGENRKLVRPVTELSSPAAKKKAEKYEYSTALTLLDEDSLNYHFLARISRGFKHQVRCHLRWCGFPILGDSDYNPDAQGPINFCASGFTFPMPNGKDMIFSLDK